MKMVLTDKAPSRQGSPGAEIEVTKSCVRFFCEQGWAVPVEAVKAEQEEANVEALRDEFKHLTDHKADARWKTETLQRKVEDARRDYLRRDMRAED